MNSTDLFQSCSHCWVFQICWHNECSTLTASSFRIWNSSTGILSPPLALFVVMLPMNQSILEVISPEYSLEGLMLKLNLQYFGQLTDWKRSWCWERLKARGEGDDRGWEGWMHHRLNGYEFEQAPRIGDRQGSLVCCSPRGRKELDMNEWLNWTEPVFLPGKPHGQRSPTGYSPRGHRAGYDWVTNTHTNRCRHVEICVTTVRSLEISEEKRE